MDETGVPTLADVGAMGEGMGAALSGGAAFVEKVDHATGGWFAVHKGKRQVKAAEKKMVLSKAALESVGVSPTDDEMRAIAFSALQDVKGFENLSAVVERLRIPDDAPAGDIEDEWMSRFVECSKEAFSEWKRVFLSDVASAKASDPSALSIGALNCIARMEAQDMETLKTLRSITPDLGFPLGGPIILFKEDGLLSLVGLDVSGIERLRDIGVLREVESRIRFDAYAHEPHEALYDGKPFIVFSQDGTSDHILLDFGGESIEYPIVRLLKKTPFSTSLNSFFDFGLFSYTTSGNELIELVPFGKNAGLSQYLDTGHKQLRQYESRANSASMFEERDFERSIRDIVKKMDRNRR